MVQATHTFNMTTGVEAEVSMLTGVEQDILTSQKNQTTEHRSLSLAASLIKRVGDVDFSSMKEEEVHTFIKGMLSSDRKLCLCEARQFSVDFDPIYDFNFDYQSVDPVKGKQTFPQTVNLDNGHFPFSPVMDFNAKMLLDKEGKPLKKLRDIEAVLRQLHPKTFANYKEVLDYKFLYFMLPQSELEIRMRMLDGVGEAIASGVTKEQRSSHTTLLMRNVCYKSNSSYISFQKGDLNKLSTVDLEAMRLVRKYVEGNVDSEIQFEHPEAASKPANEKLVTIDLANELSFFFQSGTI